MTDTIKGAIIIGAAIILGFTIAQPNEAPTIGRWAPMTSGRMALDTKLGETCWIVRATEPMLDRAPYCNDPADSR